MPAAGNPSSRSAIAAPVDAFVTISRPTHSLPRAVHIAAVRSALARADTCAIRPHFHTGSRRVIHTFHNHSSCCLVRDASYRVAIRNASGRARIIRDVELREAGHARTPIAAGHERTLVRTLGRG